jgi:hypothetical protein
MGFINQIVGWPHVVALAATGLLAIALWRRYLSPIADVPGPFAASFTRQWHVNRILKGDQTLELSRLHEEHSMRLYLFVPIN